MKKIILSLSVAIVLTSNAFFLTGCSTNSESVKNANANQVITNSNTAVLVDSNSPNMTPMPPPLNANGSAPVVVNKSKVSAPPMKEPTPEIGPGANDFALFTQARALISADKDLVNSVIIDIKSGDAVLTGKVGSEAQKSKAAQLVQSVKGIKSVKNNLQVSP